MSMLTIEFRGVTEDILKELIERGYAKTKSEAVRYALLHVGQEMEITRTVHERAEGYAFDEVKARLDKLLKRR